MRSTRFLALLFAALSVVSACAMTSGSPLVQLTGATMGTSYAISYEPTAKAADAEAVKQAVEATLARINHSMSVFDPASEISLLNQAPEHQAMVLSPELYRLLALSVEVHQQTQGAFDISLGPLIEFWGFATQKRDLAHKDRGQLEMVRTKVGLDGLTLDATTTSATKTVPGLQLNPSAIAKGDGVDAVAQTLKMLGINNALVEIGGEIKAMGFPPHRAQWQVAITQPQALNLKIQTLVPLTNQAMATSGSYANFFESNGQRFSHIIDPRTGYPSQSPMVSVSIIHSSCAIADAYATALMLFQPKQALAFASQHQLAISMTFHTPTGLKTVTNPEWPRVRANIE